MGYLMGRLDELVWLLPAASRRKAVAISLDRETKAGAHLQSVLHLDDGAVQVGGGELRGDADHLGCSLSARRCDGLHLLLQDVVGVEPPSALRKEASLLVQDEFWLHFSTRLVVDFHVHLHVFALGAKHIGPSLKLGCAYARHLLLDKF